jgi:hypothetical protein
VSLASPRPSAQRGTDDPCDSTDHRAGCDLERRAFGVILSSSGLNRAIVDDDHGITDARRSALSGA